MLQQSAQNVKGAPTASKHIDDKSSFDGEWRDTKTAEQCLAHLCLSEHLSDITFTFGDDKNVKLPAHKCILSMRSAVFEAMFNGQIAEKGDTVQIDDIEVETMKVVLRFVYMDKPDLNGDNVLRCLYAAKKYSLQGLVKQCSEFLDRNIDSDNVCSIHEQSIFYEMEPLREQCFSYILEHAQDVFVTTGFLKISYETLFKLLEDVTLSGEEIDIFKAAVNWAQDKCKAEKMPESAENKRMILDNVLFEIRFPTMPIAEFARVVTPTGILTNEEQVMLYQFLATQGSTPLTKFNREIRSGGKVTLDITKSIKAYFNGALQFDTQLGDQQGYYLKISTIEEADNDEEEEYREEDADAYEMLVNRRSLKIISIKGTFVKHLKQITRGNAQVVYNKSDEDRIVFQTPIKVNTRVMLQFDLTDKQKLPYEKKRQKCTSYKVEMEEDINGQTVYFMLVPVGLETITFSKH